MVFLEAAACGRPVVAGTSGGAPETVLDGETGTVVEPRSPDAVADAIGALLDDPARARAMGAAGRAWVEQRWSRSEEHTSELQSRQYVVCRLLLDNNNA